MGNIRYYKGHSKRDKRQMIFKVYDEPQKKLLRDETYLIEASAVEQTGIVYYISLEECELDHYVQREISESEYECYSLIQHLLTEMFMHDYTGGFPREENVLRYTSELQWATRNWLKEI